MTVFANKLEVSCKAQSNKILAAFPDVCMTPPEAPPTPPGVPIPYPNFGMDSDTDKGTGTVKIGGETVNQKNKSYFTKTTGDEAGAAAKKGVVSSKNTGKSYSQAFSMNVKAEGENLTRFSDISTNNHGSPPNVLPWPKIGAPHMPNGVDPCEGNKNDADVACGDQAGIDKACKKAGLHKKVGERKLEKANKKDGYTHSTNVTAPSGRGADMLDDATKKKIKADKVRINKDLQKRANKAQKHDCLAAMACRLPPYEESCPCPGQTGHHMVPASSFFNNGRGEDPGKDDFPIQIHEKTENPPPLYDAKKAPVICAEGCSSTTGSHGMMHTEMAAWVESKDKVTTGDLPVVTGYSGGKPELEMQPKQKAKYEDIRNEAIRSVSVVFPLSGCNAACLEAQLDAYHCTDLGMKPTQELRADKCGRASAELPSAKKFAEARKQMLIKSKRK